MCRGKMISLPKQRAQQGQRGRKTRGEMTCPRPYGEQVAEPSKVPGAAVQSLQTSLTLSRKPTEESPGVLSLQTSQSYRPKCPRPSVSPWDAAAARSSCVCIGHGEVSVSRTSPNYSVKQGWQNSLHSQGNNCGIQLLIRTIVWQEEIPPFVEPDLRGFVSCAPQSAGLGNGSQHVCEDSFGPGISSWGVDPWSAVCQPLPALTCLGSKACHEMPQFPASITPKGASELVRASQSIPKAV